MPELPEVEIVCRGLRDKITGDKIVSVTLNRSKIRQEIPKNLAKEVTKKNIETINRKAKYIIIKLAGKYSILAHLGMSGRMVVKDSYAPKKHDHAVFQLASGKFLIFNDPRRFGLIDLLENNLHIKHKLLDNLGVEPLSKELDGALLERTFASKTSPVKNVIMNQKFVVGVGNIYASESLFLSGILPTRPANKITRSECKKLAMNIKKVLEKAISMGGSSFSDYVDSSGAKGSYHNEFLVYEQAGKTCPKCQKNKIENIRLGGRSSYFCSRCQK